MYSFSEVKSLTKLVRCEEFYTEYFPELELKPNKEYCDDLVGFSKESWAKNITPKGRESKRCYEDTQGRCRKK